MAGSVPSSSIVSPKRPPRGASLSSIGNGSRLPGFSPGWNQNRDPCPG